MDSMCASALLSACRVCLASDREMYGLANTALEETYERVTSGTLVMEGRPCCVCGLCLSALRRCRRFIDTAREANDALDRWIWNQPNTDMLKLVERPLFSFIRSPMEVIDTTCQEGWKSGVKEESSTEENEDNKTIYEQNQSSSNDKDNFTPMKDIKSEDMSSDDENDHTQVSDDESNVSDNIESHSSPVLSNFEYVHIQEKTIDVEMDTEILDDLKPDKSVLENDGGKAGPGTSNVDKDPIISLEDIPLQRVGKRAKAKTDTTSGPAVKKRRRGNTGPAAALQNEGRTIWCPYCEYNCNSTKLHLLRAHLKRHNGEKRHACDMCDYKSLDRKGLQQHLLTHTGAKPFSCDKCDLKCSLKSNLRRHLLTHTSDKPYACDNCEYKCSQKSQLRQHLISHTGAKPFACDQCHTKCSEIRSFKQHVMIHTGEKPFLCDKCDFKCRDKRDLNRHLMIHSGEKPVACDKCDYRCYEKINLKYHLAHHTDEKPFACDKCDYRSNQKGGLTQHKRTHTGEKPFSCHICGYTGAFYSNFKRHLLKHTGQKPFACDKCNYKTNQKRSLQQHSLTHTGEKRYLCEHCDYRCTEKRTLRKHILRVHAERTSSQKC